MPPADDDDRSRKVLGMGSLWCFRSGHSARAFMSRSRRIADGRLLHVIRTWLTAPLMKLDEEDGGHARPRREDKRRESRRAD